MIIKSLKISNLRNITASSIEPSESLNLLYGDNGAGKTSVLEALFVLARGRSFRGGQTASLLGPADDNFRIVTDIQTDEGVTHRLGLERGRRDWSGRIDGGNVAQLSEFSACLPLVLMLPESHELVTGPPDIRRRYLDWGVFHVKHSFLDEWRRYARALSQRNAALRTGDDALVRSLDPQLVRHGLVIHEARRVEAARLEELLVDTIPRLSQALTDLEVAYQPGWRDDDLEAALDTHRTVDLERGWTSVGPHRAELVFRQGGRLARERLSRGEQKVLAAALLMAQARQLEASGVRPVLLLDDLASEFDQERLENVLAFTLELGVQCLITGTTLEPFAARQPNDTTTFHVKHGSISRC